VSPLDIRQVQPFIDGTVRTLEVQCTLNAKALASFPKGERSQPDFSIAAMIGLTSTAFNGIITLCFPEPVFLGVMSRMLNEECKKITDELEDGAAELLNIIFGQAKTILNDQGYTVQKAIPSVMRGEKLRTARTASGEVNVFPFQTEVGEFHVEICSEKEGAK
jgi:chemotaxis protein CheX